jgi:hypothetical protein
MMGLAATLDSGKTRRNTMQPKYGNAIQNAECSARQPVAAEVVQFAERLANQAQALAERVNGKLHSVMTSDCPRPCEVTGKDSIEYPPLFSDLRGKLIAINGALESIEYAISRTEL